MTAGPSFVTTMGTPLSEPSRWLRLGKQFTSRRESACVASFDHRPRNHPLLGREYPAGGRDRRCPRCAGRRATVHDRTWFAVPWSEDFWLEASRPAAPCRAGGPREGVRPDEVCRPVRTKGREPRPAPDRRRRPNGDTSRCAFEQTRVLHQINAGRSFRRHGYQNVPETEVTNLGVSSGRI
jgi:hypothetical protein